MTNILTKIIKANQEYEILGGGSSSAGEEHEVITQAAYDQLTPAQKAEKVYMIKESGTPTPSPMPGSVDSFNRFITNQPLLEISGSGSHNNITMPEGATFVVCKQPNSDSATWVGSITPLNMIIEAGERVILGDRGGYTHITYKGNNEYDVSLYKNSDVVYVF